MNKNFKILQKVIFLREEVKGNEEKKLKNNKKIIYKQTKTSNQTRTIVYEKSTYETENKRS